MLVVIGSVAFLVAIRHAPAADVTAVAAYLASLIASFAVSAAYNIWPVSSTKWRLRRFDQSAIYLLIAGTYTPFLVVLQAWGALSIVWTVAFVGVALRICQPDRFDRLSIALYLLLGWSGVLMLDQVISGLPSATPWLIGAGGLIYSLGVIFHAWDSLRFQNAIWHGFVLVAASIHYAAVWSAVVATV